MDKNKPITKPTNTTRLPFRGLPGAIPTAFQQMTQIPRQPGQPFLAHSSTAQRGSTDKPQYLDWQSNNQVDSEDYEQPNPNFEEINNGLYSAINEINNIPESSRSTLPNAPVNTSSTSFETENSVFLKAPSLPQSFNPQPVPFKPPLVPHKNVSNKPIPPIPVFPKPLPDQHVHSQHLSQHIPPQQIPPQPALPQSVSFQPVSPQPVPSKNISNKPLPAIPVLPKPLLPKPLLQQQIPPQHVPPQHVSPPLCPLQAKGVANSTNSYSADIFGRHLPINNSPCRTPAERSSQPNESFRKDPLKSTSSIAEFQAKLRSAVFNSEVKSSRPLPPIPIEETEFNNLDRQPYFHRVSREEAVIKVQSLQRDGTFLVRPSQKGNSENPYALTLFEDSRVIHLNIRLNEGKYVLGKSKSNEKTFDSVETMISYHESDPIMVSFQDGTAKECCLRVTPQK